MSPRKSPDRNDPSAARRPRADASASDNPWASYDDADDWSITGDRPPSRSDATGRLQIEDGAGRKLGQRLETPLTLRVMKAAEGLQANQTFTIAKSSVTLGRGKDNDVVLPDASVSRHHAVLELRGDTFWVIDKQSGNGVFVSGQRVAEAPIKPGTAWSLGQIALRIDVEGESAASRTDQSIAARVAAVRGDVQALSQVSAVVGPGPQAHARGAWARLRRLLEQRKLPKLRALPMRKKVVASGLCLGLLVLGVTFGRIYLRHLKASEKCFQLCSQGIQAFAAQRWDDAEHAFVDALSVRPHHVLTLSYKDALAAARHDWALLQDVKERRERGDFAGAQEALAQLGATPFFDAAWAESVRYDKAVTELATQAETALGAGLIAEGRGLLQNFANGPNLRPDIGALLAWSGLRTAYGPLEAQARSQSLRPRAPPSLWEQAQTQSRAMRVAIARFRLGTSYSGPARALQSLPLPQTPAEEALVRALKRFVSLNETALTEHRGKRAFAAIKIFGEARQEAVNIAGEGSQPAKEIDWKMADMYYVLGVQGLMGGHLAEASEALHTAVRLRPGHSLSLRRIEELEDRAKRMVDEAEFLGPGHASRAQELLRQVQEAMPASSEAASRARKLQRTLGMSR